MTQMIDDIVCLKNYRNLWLNVLIVAMKDYHNISSDRQNYWRQYSVSLARGWFDLDNDDFIMVCGFANVCPRKMIKNIKLIKKNEFKNYNAMKRRFQKTTT